MGDFFLVYIESTKALFWHLRLQCTCASILPLTYSFPFSFVFLPAFKNSRGQKLQEWDPGGMVKNEQLQ